MRGLLILMLLPAICLVCVTSGGLFAAEQAQTLSPMIIPVSQEEEKTPPGDRVTCRPAKIEEWIPAALSRSSYRLCPGDTLSINVTGRSALNYIVRPDAPQGSDRSEVTVSPAGDVYLPLVGKITAAGRTADELEGLVREALSRYFKHFEVAVTLSRVRTVNVWMSGELDNPGPQIMPAVSTASLAVLQSGIKPTGSTRRITVVRNGTRRTVDLYKMVVTGSVDQDAPLEPGDTVLVPPVINYVEVSGEVTRPGRYEMVPMSEGADLFRLRDLTELALGTTPAACLDKAFIERITEDGTKKAVNVSLKPGSGDLDMALLPGDKLVIPSIEAFQPMVRLIGEFKGEGVYQRAIGATSLEIQSKSGIYFLKQGQTAGDVITTTGGVTPQADLKRARIERQEGGKTIVISLDLERLLINGDKTADVPLKNGDSLVLPAVADKIHVFGEVKVPGSYLYSPNRRLLDYLGNAGGHTSRAKLTEVGIVRGEPDDPTVIRLNVKQAMQHGLTAANPVLNPGDIVYVPSKFVSDWRDAMQVVFTSLSLVSLFERL